MNDEIPDAPDPYLGRLMGGRYEMLERVGIGAMGMVYRARQRSIDKEVAVKVLHTHIGAQENLRKRFAQEARVGSRFQHPGSVEVLDFGVHFDGTVFLVMEFLRGRSLDHLIRAEAPLPLSTVVEVIDQVLSAVAAAHDAGIVHRDLKPENVMLLPSDDARARWRVKVADFGLAKLLEDTLDSGERAKLTATGMFHGTPGFIAPEQAQARTVDGRADLYSCGVMIFEMCTGRLPFTADTAMGMVLQHITEPAPPLSRVRADTDPRLEALVLRAMQKRPEDRFADARAMRAALRALSDDAAHRPSVLPSISGSGPDLAISGSGPDFAISGSGPDAVITEPAPAITAPAPPPALAAPVSPALDEGVASRRRGATAVGLVAASALAVAAVVTVVASTARTPPPPRAAPSVVAPSVAAPRVAAPSVAAPSVAAPSVVAPSVVAPSPVVPSPSVAVARFTHPSLRVSREPSPAPSSRATSVVAPTPLAPSLAAPSLAAPSRAVDAPAPSTPPPPSPVVAAAPSVAPPPAPPLALPSLVRAVRGDIGAVHVSGGVARTSVSSRVAQAAEALARCVEHRVRGTDALRDPATVTVEVSVRDRRLDAISSRGAPSAECDAAMRAAFAGDLPPSEDLEYAITFQVELTASR